MSNISLQKNINLASKSQINTLQAEIDAIQIEINNLQSDITTQQGEIISLQNDIISIQNDIITLQNDVNALETATLVSHEPIVTSSVSSSSPGQIPDVYIVSEALLGLKFISTDEAYRVFRLESTYVSDASLHIHWTKSSDANEAGKVVKWRVRYCVFTCIDGNAATIYEVSNISTYVSSDLTSRIIYRTADMDISANVAPIRYVGVKVDYIAAETTLTSSPVLVSMDLITRNYIN